MPEELTCTFCGGTGDTVQTGPFKMKITDSGPLHVSGSVCADFLEKEVRILRRRVEEFRKALYHVTACSLTVKIRDILKDDVELIANLKACDGCRDALLLMHYGQAQAPNPRDAVIRRLTDALNSIQIRCTEGSPEVDWRSIINRIATRALEGRD